MFKKAERNQVSFKMALSGPSGSGKTYSSLLIAMGLGKKIAVIDTENRSACLYSDLCDFDILELDAPYTSEKYIAAMKQAEAGKYDVLIIDSATHQWMGDGGLYERKTAKDARGGNSFTNWSSYTPEHNKFLNAIIQHPTHVICTVRSKQDYDVNDKGRPQKIGLGPIQREGFEYEFSLVLDMAMDHSAKASKDRTGLFSDGQIFQPSDATGSAILEWIKSAKKIPGSGVFCSVCKDEVVLHKNGLGYHCPKWTHADNGHTKFPVIELQAYQGPQTKGE